MGRPKFSNYIAPLILAVIVIIVIIAALLSGGKEPAKKPAKSSPQTINTSCGPYRKDGVVTINGSQINVETVEKPNDRIKGLSGRPCIASNWGMLFDFDSDGHYVIWMKDMKFPIDVAWISSRDHKVVALEVNFQPSTYNKQQPEKSEKRVNQAPARYVLELSANRSKQLNMDLGTPIHFHKT